MRTPHPFPMPPRGEKPQTTIRLLRKNIRDLAQTVQELRDEIFRQAEAAAIANQAHFNDEAGSRFKISELETQFLLEQARADQAETDVRRIEAALHIMRLRNAYLEGYYAKSAEILPDDKAQTLARAGARTPANIPHGQPIGTAGWQETAAGGPDRGTGD